MANAIRLVIPDAGPFISLGMADRLDILDAFDVPLATLDVVKEEALHFDWPGRDTLRRWFSRNHGAIEIIESPIMPIYLAAMEKEHDPEDITATRGLGDAAISWFVANAPFLSPPRGTLLVLTEDASFGDSRLGRDVHVLSTRAFLRTLEDLQVIDSAREILGTIEQRGRTVSPYQADRPALVGAKGRSKTNWASALKARGGVGGVG